MPGVSESAPYQEMCMYEGFLKSKWQEKYVTLNLHKGLFTMARNL